MCDEEPVVSNSVSNVKKNVSSSEGEYLRGTTIEYLCKKHFAQNVTIVTCDDAGKWQPPSIYSRFIYKYLVKIFQVKFTLRLQTSASLNTLLIELLKLSLKN